ncbi:MAG: hypothetical protein KBC67_00505 [Candidatus Pacebacteria bacterium]|nr:hypothetical protein [Candidatus Paceibacterota bacterium]
MTKRTKIIIIIIIVLITLLAIVAICFSTPNIRNYIFPKKFDSIEWVKSYERFQSSNVDGNSAYRELSNRKKMAYSLIRSANLIGKNKEQVKDLIGIDDNTYNASVWLYWIDFTAADNKWLKVTFDGEIVTTVSVYED